MSVGSSASSQFPPESATLSAPSNTEARITSEGPSTPHPTQTEFSSFLRSTSIQHSGTGQVPLTFSPGSVSTHSGRSSMLPVISEEASTEPLSPGPSSGTQGSYSPSKATAYSDEPSLLGTESMSAPTSSLPRATGTLQSPAAPASTTPMPSETSGPATSPQGGLAPGTQLAGSTEGTMVTRTAPESGAHASQPLTASTSVALSDVMERDTAGHTSSSSGTSEWSSDPSAGTSASIQFPTDSVTRSVSKNTEGHITRAGSSTPYHSNMGSSWSLSATSIKPTVNGHSPWTLTPDSLSIESRRTTLPSVISVSAATGPVSSWPSSSTLSFMNLSKTTESSQSPRPLVHLSSVVSASYLSEGTRYVKSGDAATSQASRPCSIPDFHIQLEEVTSQVIEFSWSLQNDRKDGPYMVTLMVDNRIINETITDHTRMVFRNLSPGYQYTITVEVRSCAKINTSITVWTDAIAFSGTTRITNEVYKPQYSNKSSSEFQNFQKMFVKEIRNHLPSTLIDLADSGKLCITVIDLREGSVIVAFNINMATDQNTTYSEVEDAVTDALRKSTALKVDPNSTSVRVIPLCELGNNYCSEYANCLSNGETASCQCRPQFEDQNPLVPGKTCTDINECSNKMDDCSNLASCINTIGSYECHCYSSMKDMNLTNPGRMCQDPTVCFNRTDFCSLPTNKCLDKQSYICSNGSLKATCYFSRPKMRGCGTSSSSVVDKVFKGMTSKLGGNNFDIIMVGYQNGSLIAYFVLLIHGQQFIEEQNLTADLTDVIQTMLDNQTDLTVRAISVSAISTQKPVKEDLTWKTAVIVLGVLFGIMLIFLLVIIFVCHYMKSRSGRYDIEPQGLMGKFAYRYL
uniref:Uncharacterized protein n=1 Tax=Sphaerodactylus townsendi TaxID=933632 RepID=A0ACB8FI40_9SAUR